jgi:hypothetical protein
MCCDLISLPPLRGSVGEKLRNTAMQQIADWFEKLGMSEYAQRFAENDIDFEILFAIMAPLTTFLD